MTAQPAPYGLSCQPCGCDPEAKWKCKRYPDCDYGLSLIGAPSHEAAPASHVTRALAAAEKIMTDLKPAPLDVVDDQIGSKLWRKQRPLYSGVLAYFPDALLEVANVSFVGNEQHNPGEPLRWSREKSSDHLDCIARHLTNHSVNPVDTDGAPHLAKVAWRALAELQLYLERTK